MLYNQFSEPKMSFLDFRQSIIETILVDHSKKENRNQTKYNVTHFAAKCETGMRGRKLQKRCRWCSKHSVRKDAMYYCSVSRLTRAVLRNLFQGISRQFGVK